MERESNFQRARGRFERKRKSTYPYDNDNDSRERDRDRDSRRHGGGGGGRDRDRDSIGSSRSRRRSQSPHRWERGKKQQKKTATDVPPERELFVGNIPSNIQEQFLLNFVNGAMRHVNLCLKHETPAISCQINTGNFAFVEMVSADMANKCLNLNGVLFLNARIKVGRPKKYAGPFVVAKTWQELTGEELLVDGVLDAESEKVNRELFVGNTTPEMTEQTLKDYLGAAMEQVGLTVMVGNPIKNCEMFGKYAFIELRTPREAENALNLNNIPFMGVNLQVTRPSKWTGKWDTHSNWEHILAKHNMTPDQFQLGTVISPSVIAAMPTTPEDTMNVGAIKAELEQVKKALEITRRQLDETTKKSEARKEQLVSLNRKWAEGKNELTEHKTQLTRVRQEMRKGTAVDMDSIIEAQELKKKHEETQNMLRGVTESLVKATEKLASERKARKELEKLVGENSMSSDMALEEDIVATVSGTGTGSGRKPPPPESSAIDFNSLRAELDGMKTEPMEADDDAMADDYVPAANTATNLLETPRATASSDDDDLSKMDSLKEFLSKTPKTPIDWSAGASRASESTPHSRDRAGVRLCRLLVHAPDMDAKDASEIQSMTGKYNLGGYIKPGKPGLVVIEGLEFNCDIFMDNLTSQKKKFRKAGKVSERSGRAFPKELSRLDGASAMESFSKACESVGLKDALETACAS